MRQTRPTKKFKDLIINIKICKDFANFINACVAMYKLFYIYFIRNRTLYE